MRTISRGVAGAVLFALAAVACTSESDLPAPTPVNWSSATNTTGTAALAASLLHEKDMIVIYRDQMADLRSKAETKLRAAAFQKVHAPLIAELNATKPRDTRSFGLINAFQAKLSAEEVQTLSLRPEIGAIVENRTFRLPKRQTQLLRSRHGGSPAPVVNQQICGTLEPEALQVTHTAYLDPTIPSATSTLDGNGQKITGKGVKVAYIADGLDIHNTGFVRPDGSSIFYDYQDFSGDAPTVPTGGAEAFGDASSIAGQDNVLDLSQFVDGGLPSGTSPCTIHVRGMAPDASLAGLKIISASGYGSTASWVQAIEWAVVHDDVDVINESLGSNPIYDDNQDPVSLANAAAVRAGVTITVSSGDAGTTGTVGSPSTESSVIGVGATTTFRAYQQIGLGVPLYTGFLSNNISAFSSGGFSQRRARTVDLVAPGDFGWAYCSTDTTTYTECGTFGSTPMPLQLFGGTSESAPLVAGAAALVIQAYRSTHRGESPTPATVKAILASSSHDLSAPSDEQGAGLVDSLRAVQIALSFADGRAHPAPEGAGLVASPSSFTFAAQPYDVLARELDVTNTGAAPKVLRPTLDKLGAPVASGATTVAIDPTTFYTGTTFNVPAGLDHLDAAIAFQGTATPAEYVVFELIDPTGHLAAYSNPQGPGSDYGRVDVVKPTAGTWTMYAYAAGDVAYLGPVKFTWAGERYVTAGVVFPPVAYVAPGQSAHFVAALATTGQAGDVAAAVRFGDDLGNVPISVRTLVGVGPHGGTWSGTLTGGNGRPGALPTQTYAFDVPNGHASLGVQLNVQPGYGVSGFLVDPHGKTMSTGSTVDETGALAAAVELDHADPEAGRWSVVLETIAVSGAATSSPFTGAVALDKVNISAPTLPTSKNTKISKASGLTVPVRIKNTGPTTRSYWADARLAKMATIQVAQVPCSQTETIPGLCIEALVPPRATGAVFIAQSNEPLDMSANWAFGGPEIWGKTVAPNTVAAQINADEVPWFPWLMYPQTIGPYTNGAAAPLTGTAAYAEMPPFDSNVTSIAGNAWADLVNQPATPTWDPTFTIAPGQTKTLDVHIGVDVAAPIGSVVKGFLSIDAINEGDAYAFGDELITLPYAYTVKK